MRNTVDRSFDEGEANLPDDEVTEELDSDCVDTFVGERLVVEATELEEEVDELKGAIDTCVIESTGVLPDDEFAEKTAVDCVDTVANEGLVIETIELTGEVDELKDAIDTYVDEGTAVLADDEFVEETAIDCVEMVANEGLVMEAIELTGEVDELKDAIDTYVNEGTAVLADDELTDKITVDCVDTIADEGLVMEATELMGELGADMVEVFNGSVAQ